MRNIGFAVPHTFWPVAIILVLVAAAFFTNEGVVTTIPNQQQNGLALPQLQNNLMLQSPNGFALPNGQQNQPFEQVAQTLAMPNSTAINVQEGISEVVSQVRPSVVSVSRVAEHLAKPNGNALTFIDPFLSGDRVKGSGVIIDRRGYVLTTYQTVGKDKVVRVKLYTAGQRDFHAKVLAIDPKTDLAVLKIQANAEFPAAQLGNSDMLEVGDFVFAIGNPYGFSGSVTMGIVSSNHRKLQINGINYPEMIQIDAPINEGNDGGALVDINGRVIGINMATYMPHHQFSGIGFAVPINDIMAFLNSNR